MHTNAHQAVDALLAVLGVSGDTLVPVPSWHYTEPEGHVTVVKGDDGALAMPLHTALARCYDLRSPRGDTLVKLLLSSLSSSADGTGAAAAAVKAPAANGTAKGQVNGKVKGNASAAVKSVEQQVSELTALAADKVALDDYLTPRHVIDMLRDYPAAHVTVDQVGSTCAKVGVQCSRRNGWLSPGIPPPCTWPPFVLTPAPFQPQTRPLPATQLLPTLRQLQPRLYSISSSPLEDGQGVQATIAVVRYSSLGDDRVGVCSTFVAERTQVGDRVPVFISKNPNFRLPADPSTPVIMVGPGTGLAPFRAFIVHRLLERGADPTTLGGEGGGNHSSQAAQQRLGGPMVLYFGCRRSEQDYLYGADLERWAAAGAVELHTAFSREKGRPKVYVQQRLEESADRVWELLEAGGHFYVCGDANNMAGAVEQTLLRIIATRLPGGLGEAGAKAYLQRLSDTHRYERDVWFS